MKINEDYSDIERQIKDLGQFLETCTDKNQYYSAATSFGILNYLYCLRYGNEFVSGEVADNITRKGMELYQEILENEKSVFLRNKQFHKDTFFENFFGPSSSFLKVCRGSYLKKMKSSEKTKLKTGEDKEILEAFFKESFPEGSDILGELLERGHLFKFFDEDDEFSSSNGFMTFNRCDNAANVFLRDDVCSLSSLVTLVHELGHVYDFSDSVRTFTDEEKARYALGPYAEVMSSYYQQLFLDYLISNGIRTEEATVAFFELYSSFFYNLDNALLLSLVSDDEYRLIVGSDFKKREVISLLRKSSLAEDYDFDDNYALTVMSGTKEIGYSYGILLSNMLIDGSISKDDWFGLRAKEFDSSSLTSIGFSKDKANKCLVKKMDTFMKK